MQNEYLYFSPPKMNTFYNKEFPFHFCYLLLEIRNQCMILGIVYLSKRDKLGFYVGLFFALGELIPSLWEALFIILKQKAHIV